MKGERVVIEDGDLLGASEDEVLGYLESQLN